MILFRQSLAALLGCALVATTVLVADAGLVSQVAVLAFTGAAGVVVAAEESPRVMEEPEGVVIPDRVLQEDTPSPSVSPTSAPTMAPDSPTNAPTSGGAALFVGGGASKAAMSCALAALAGGAMAAAV